MEHIKNDAQPLRVMELFAGVGGFRYGLNQVQRRDGGAGFQVAWANQWEPGSKNQWAADVYRARWGANDIENRDIFQVLDDPEAMAKIDALAPEVLVGGFPCQDYSVAKPLSQSQGLAGKKGVLWWAIHQLLESRAVAGNPVKYLILENVDRLIASPHDCKGRDFAVMLASLQSLGYAVEWRIVNAADYGFAQKRKRVFILGYHCSTPTYRHIEERSAPAWLLETGTMAQALPTRLKDGAKPSCFDMPTDVFSAQDDYTMDAGRSRFLTGGVVVDGRVCTAKMDVGRFEDCTRFTGHVAPLTLGDAVQFTESVPNAFFLDEAALPRWRGVKGSKSIERVSVNGHAYTFSEGAMAFPDPLDRPSRTIITSEGGKAASRSTHVIANADCRLRRLVPAELETLNGFPIGFTDIPGISDAKRAFLMGNALVTGLVTVLGRALLAQHGAEHSVHFAHHELANSAG